MKIDDDVVVPSSDVVAWLLLVVVSCNHVHIITDNSWKNSSSNGHLCPASNVPRMVCWGAGRWISTIIQLRWKSKQQPIPGYLRKRGKESLQTMLASCFFLMKAFEITGMKLKYGAGGHVRDAIVCCSCQRTTWNNCYCSWNIDGSYKSIC